MGVTGPPQAEVAEVVEVAQAEVAQARAPVAEGVEARAPMAEAMC